MKTLTKNTLIQVLIGGALFLPALWLGREYAILLLGFYGVMLAVVLLGKGFVRIVNRLDAHLRRVYGPKPKTDPPPRHHQDFDDAL